MTPRTSVESFLRRTKTNPKTGCIVWLGAINKGYGQVSVGNRSRIAHRWYYEQAIGKIPDGMFLDHICRNKRCVNPRHLRPVTPAENNTLNSLSPAALNLVKTHCKRGHPLSGANLRIRKDGSRNCKTCNVPDRTKVAYANGLEKP